MESIGWKTIYEMLFGVARSYDHLQVIGCLCYISKKLVRRGKFESRGLKLCSLVMLLVERGIEYMIWSINVL